MPFYNVPDITGFKLKPYVPHATPQIDEDRKVKRIVEMTSDVLATIAQQVEDASRGRLETIDHDK